MGLRRLRRHVLLMDLAAMALQAEARVPVVLELFRVYAPGSRRSERRPVSGPLSVV
jgi:hypothetical protein